MTFEREIINQRIRELVHLAGIGGSREAQEELQRLMDLDVEYVREEKAEIRAKKARGERLTFEEAEMIGERYDGWFTIYENGWSEERTRRAIEYTNRLIAQAIG